LADNKAKGYEVPILRGGGCGPDEWSVKLDVSRLPLDGNNLKTHHEE